MFNQLFVEVVDTPEQFRLIAPLLYHSELGGFAVPVDFVTDFASIPKPLRCFFTVNGVHRKPAVLHDYLYSSGSNCYSRYDADLLFLEAMRVVGVGWMRRHVIYKGVRIFGGSRWNKKQ